VTGSTLEQTLAAAVAGQFIAPAVPADVDIVRRSPGTAVDLTGHEPGQDDS